jgi:hypothetical protein
MLHAYGVYSFGWILLPPWFSVMDEDGYREVSDDNINSNISL